jgi:hypothetical protein
MKGPTLAYRIDYVEHFSTLKIPMLDLALQSSGRCHGAQLVADRTDERKSGTSERILDFAASIQFQPPFTLSQPKNAASSLAASYCVRLSREISKMAIT